MNKKVNLTFRQTILSLQNNQKALLKQLKENTDINSLETIYASLETIEKSINALLLDKFLEGLIATSILWVIFGSLVKIATIIY